MLISFIMHRYKKQKNTMTEEKRRQLQQQLWNIANTLHGKMDADEFRWALSFANAYQEKLN